jgi:octaprenyl-diphosphate synthase
LGIAFQIVDDALDYVEDRAKVGKPLGADLKERKVTLPLSRLLQVATAGEKTALSALLRKDIIEDGDVLAVVDMMSRHEVLPYTRAEARKYVERAKSRLNGAGQQPGGAPLMDLADFVVERNL